MGIISQKFLKAKQGDFFYDRIDCADEPRLLRFISLHQDPHNVAHYVTFEDAQTNISFFVSADDRYGYFPPLSKRNRNKIEGRICELRELRDQLEVYEGLQAQIDLYANKTTGV